MILKAALSLTWICQEGVGYIPGLHSWATKFRTSTAAGHCWMNSSQNELSSNSWAITRHALKRKRIHLKCYKIFCWIQSWLYSSEFKGVLRVVLNLTLILAGPSPKAAFPCFIDGFTEAFAQCVTGTLINNTQTLKGSEDEFLLPTPPEKGHRNSCNSLGCRCPKPGLTWFLFQQGAGPLPLLGLSHLLLQEVRCE